MNNPYTDAPVSSESIWLDDTEVSVVLRSFPSGCTEVAIKLVTYCPESGMEAGWTLNSAQSTPAGSPPTCYVLLMCSATAPEQTYPG